MTKEVDLIVKIIRNKKKIYLYLGLDLLVERNVVKIYRVLLGYFIKVIKTVDLSIVVVKYKYEIEVLNRNICNYSNKYIESAEKFLTQRNTL